MPFVWYTTYRKLALLCNINISADKCDVKLRLAMGMAVMIKFDKALEKQIS